MPRAVCAQAELASSAQGERLHERHVCSTSAGAEAKRAKGAAAAEEAPCAGEEGEAEPVQTAPPLAPSPRTRREEDEAPPCEPEAGPAAEQGARAVETLIGQIEHGIVT